jgi:cytochrome c oxidase accessory protein FixG
MSSTTQTHKGGGEKRRPDLDTLYSVNADGSRNMLHPADVKGRWQVRLNLVWGLLLLIYVGLPWIRIGGYPAVHIDIPARQAHLFGTSFTNQDFYLMFFVLTGVGFALFSVTAVFGRIWCGFACPQTVFMEGVFRRVERLIEGPRNARIRRNAGPWDFDKVWRKGLKNALFVLISLVITHVFLSYFIPVRELLRAIPQGPGEHMVAFGWLVFFSVLGFVNFAWFREQTCLIICPYGRLQSALVDEDTIVIGYDSRRGEPRTLRKDEGGDCIDCFRCVEVCPTGVDIRNGLQMECVGCTRCIDACDDVMRKIGKPEGLVRYDSRRAFETGERKSLLRPRFYIYILFGLLGLTIASVTVSRRATFQANVLRARGMPYTVEEGRIRNLLNLHLQNKQDRPMVLRVEPELETAGVIEFLIPQQRVQLEPMQDLEFPIFAYVARDTYQGAFPTALIVSDSLSGDSKRLEITFRGP